MRPLVLVFIVALALVVMGSLLASSRDWRAVASCGDFGFIVDTPLDTRETREQVAKHNATVQRLCGGRQ